MLSFECDYNNGAHEKVLEALIKSNSEALPGYGTDVYTERAKEKIRKACDRPDADVYFTVGGTQTNQLVISTMLHPYEGVIAADTGHVSLHEAGAIEYTGHKVLMLPGKDGKLKAEDLLQYLKTFFADGNHEHMVQPGMAYISQPTEYGTLYTKAELEAVYEVCASYSLPLFIDGARLGYGLASAENDVDLKTLSSLCDVFYIGGTKVGALLGEAIVFTHHHVPDHFVTQLKQHGALLAKGRVLGVQFDALFTDDLYLELGRHAILQAEKLKDILKEKNLPFFLESPTNQQFVILENDRMEKLKKSVNFSYWEAYDANHTVVRFATSWSTKDEDLEALRVLL